MPLHLSHNDNKENFVFNASRDWKPMEMFLDLRRYMGVPGQSGNESRSLVEYSLKGRQPGLRKTDQQRITVVGPGADKGKTEVKIEKYAALRIIIIFLCFNNQT